METAIISNNGTIVIPPTILQKLGLKSGDRIAFIENNNNMALVNLNLLTLHQTQEALKGVAVKAGIQDENDILKLVSDIRKNGTTI